MLTLEQLHPFDFYKYFRLVTKEADLQQPISNVVIMEYESVYGDYSGFSEGDFILTSLFFARENPDLILDAFQHLVEKKVCGIAIKEVCFKELPEQVLSFAQAHHLPIFFFRDYYMEDIILEISAYQKRISKNEYYEKMIQDLLTNKSKDDLVATLREGLHAPSNAFVLSTFVLPHSSSATSFGQRRRNKIIFDSTRHGKNQYDCFPYQEGLLFFFYLSEPKTEKEAQLHILQRLEHLGLTQDMRLFLCDVCVPIQQFIDSLQNCFYTYQLQRSQSNPCSFYSRLGTMQLLRPLFCDSGTIAQLQKMQKILLSYDEKQDSQLMETLKYYVKNNFEIKKTAEILYQHPNTIRYRVGKIQQLLDLENIQDFYLFSILLTEMHCYFSDTEDILL